jgi:hypothetical protein
MEIEILIIKFNETIDVWIDELKHYNYYQLCLRPNADSWSLGQVYEHLINDTKYYFQQIKECIASNENEFQEMTDTAKNWFENNSLPNTKMVGPPGIEAPPNPNSKEQLFDDLNKLKFEMNEIGIDILNSSYKGKTKHPAFQYFNSVEWFQYAEMHFRHHLRQSNTIKIFLKLN